MKKIENLDSYIVGGYVRDELLNISSNDIDYVVINSNSEEMLSLGFKKVGADFDVYLHPKTKDEYALARYERKIGKKYNDFETIVSNVSLEDDLKRRDLTINAIAKDKNNNYIDPFNGITDLNNKILRHTSNAFKEDPLRILRVARFSARFPDFKIALETKKLIQDMINDNMLKYLTPERIFKETKKALLENKPSNYFNFFIEYNILDVLFPIEKVDDNFKNKIDQLDNIKTKVLKLKLNKDASINILFNYLLLDFSKEDLLKINKINGNLPIDIKKNALYFKSNNFKNNFNYIQSNFHKQKYINIINFFEQFNNLDYSKIELLYHINKFTNSNRQNSKLLINIKDFKLIYNTLKKSSIKNYIQKYKNKNGKIPSVEKIKETKIKIKTNNLILIKNKTLFLKKELSNNLSRSI